MAYLPALTTDSVTALRCHFGDQLIPLSDADAEIYAANSFHFERDGQSFLVMPEGISPALAQAVRAHGTEIITPVLALYASEQLTTQYGIDPTITDLVNEYEIWIAPVWNPDGYVHVFNVDNFWRKNRHVFEDGIGVELNRNYPFGWDSPCAGSTDPSDGGYKGPVPASESETQTMIALSEDRRFGETPVPMFTIPANLGGTGRTTFCNYKSCPDQ